MRYRVAYGLGKVSETYETLDQARQEARAEWTLGNASARVQIQAEDGSWLNVQDGRRSGLLGVA
jgi:hypothetical protein